MCERVKFMYNWAHSGHPTCFWLSGFFFPHGFLTGTLQTYARKRSKPIDTLAFNFKLMAETKAEEILEAPEDGVYIYGLFILGAKWSPKDQILVEPEPGEMFCQMPIIHFIPEETPPAVISPNASPKKDVTFNRSESEEIEAERFYSCPVYKTSERAGTLSTTGQSTNFILAVSLPCGYQMNEATDIMTDPDGQAITHSISGDASATVEEMEDLSKEPQHWIMRGTAMLTMLDF
jgi:dynein heavy chain